MGRKPFGVSDFPCPPDARQQTLEFIDSVVGPDNPFSGPEWIVVRNMIRVSADFDLLSLARVHSQAVAAGTAALKNRRVIITDTEPIRTGLSERVTEVLGCRAFCFAKNSAVRILAQKQGLTRDEAAVEASLRDMGGGIYVIGGSAAPLFRLLDLVKQGADPPALIVGMPAGFVGVAESKDALMSQDRVPYICLAGNKGGEAVCAAAVNALADVVLDAGESGA